MQMRVRLVSFLGGVTLAFAQSGSLAFAQSSPFPASTPSPARTATAIPVESASPLPVESPSPSPSASAAPTTTASSTPGALTLTRAAVAVAPKQIVAVGVDGATGQVAVSASNAFVTVRYDSASTSVVVTGVTLGTSSVSVSDASGAVATLEVSVLPAAGVVPGDVTVALGGTVSPQFAAAKVNAAIARAAQMQPGGSVAVRGVTISNPLHEGDELEAVAHVAITAGSAFADQSGVTQVHLRVETLSQLEPAFLFYSDDPERLGADGDGVLYRSTIDADKPARVYAYHVSDISGRRLYLALSTTGVPAQVQILGYAAGPTDAFAYVGHVSTLQYLLERATQESSIVDVSGDAPHVQQLGYRALNAGELVAAIFDLRVTSGGPVSVAVVAVSGTGDPVERLADPEHAGDGHGRRGEFALASVPPFAMTYAAGDPEPSPIAVGVPTIPNLRPGGRPLGGDYGALRNVSLQLSNPASTPQTVYLYEQAVGGTATTTFWFTGDARPTEIPCIKVVANRYLVKAFSLDPAQSLTVTGEYMTDGSASFPLDFGLTTSAPSPAPGPYSADACNPKAPPATPSPSASASPAASAAPDVPAASPPAPPPPAPAPSATV